MAFPCILCYCMDGCFLVDIPLRKYEDLLKYEHSG